MEGGEQFFHALAFKGDDILNPGYATHKTFIISAVFNTGHVAPVTHAFHGLIPNFFKNSLAASTW